MKIPVWTKPGLVGAFAGVIFATFAGFSAGGWMSESSAREQAVSHARDEVVAALVTICIAQSREDPQFTASIQMLKEARTFDRSRKLMDIGWATMPGSSEPNSRVAFACMDALAAEF
jgi:hypothetical protein